LSWEVVATVGLARPIYLSSAVGDLRAVLHQTNLPKMEVEDPTVGLETKEEGLLKTREEELLAAAGLLKTREVEDRAQLGLGLALKREVEQRRKKEWGSCCNY